MNPVATWAIDPYEDHLLDRLVPGPGNVSDLQGMLSWYYIGF